ncbi:MAG TPA: hypothetical protein ENH82_03660 [bacterium]|nr:hypothetical protein [bacterium]
MRPIIPSESISACTLMYGVTYLHGKSLHESVVSLINIAYPKFRDELKAEAKAQTNWTCKSIP